VEVLAPNYLKDSMPLVSRAGSYFSAVICAVILMAGSSLQAQPPYEENFAINRARIAEAINFLDSLNNMRSALAAGIQGSHEKITEGTFAQVCKPVGAALKSKALEQGWTASHVAKRYRNPAHALGDKQRNLFNLFMDSPKLDALVLHDMHNSQIGFSIYRRINVEDSCLACHGAQSSRPNFIVSKYPKDLAYNFKSGDLRGLYWVFIPG
jgi:hypothetical protein